MDWPSALVGFLAGTLTGAAGSYLGQKFTDQRYRSEAKKESDQIWLDLKSRFPEVIQEMADDVQREPHVRNFFVKKSTVTVSASGPCFEYNTGKHMNLKAAIAHIEELGLVEDITPGNCPMYRIRENFYDLLQNS